MAAWVVRDGEGVIRDLDVASSLDVAAAFQVWLADLALAPASSAPVFWAPHGWQSADDWMTVTSAEQLAVRISTSWRPRGNVCFASGSPGVSGRNVGVIALIQRDELGWAVNLNDGIAHQGAVMRRDYEYDNYDSFSALTAAQISWAWIASGTVPEGLSLRRR